MGVPVLDYHRIVPVGGSAITGDRFAVHATEFRDHLQVIQDLNMTVVAPEEISARRGAARSVALTFDDGYSSHYEVAFRLLAEFNMSGTFFVITSRVGTGEYLDWMMAAEMARGGMRFGSHTHSHVVLTTLNSSRLKEELYVSRQTLEQRLACAIETLAVPYGFCDHHVLDAAWESGYGVVCTSTPWPAKEGERVLPRVGITRQTSLSGFRKLMEKDPTAYLRLWARDRALAIPRYVFVRVKPDLLGVRTAEDTL